jgi:endonuclease YncB( thermonuclease family)
LLAALLMLVLAACHQVESPSLPRGGKRVADPEVHETRGLTLKGRSQRVQDGDSFVARLDDGSQRTIRLSGIDAPERSQPAADASMQNLRRLIDSRDLQIQVAKTDPYGRAVAQVFVEQEGRRMDVGLSQVTAGMAWFYRHYRQDLPAGAGDRYAEAEHEARAAMRGLWREDHPQPPWEFRRHPETNQSPRR